MVYIPLGPIVCNPDVIPKSEIYSIHVKCYVGKKLYMFIFQILNKFTLSIQIAIGRKIVKKVQYIKFLIKYHTNVTCRKMGK